MKLRPLMLPLFVGILVALLLMPMSQQTRPTRTLLDMVHAPAFALLAIVVMAAGRRRLPRSAVAAGLVTWVGVSLFGGVAEWVQGLVGRGPSLHDALANCLGAAAGAAFMVGRGAATPRGRQFGLLLACGLLIVAQWGSIRTLYDCWRARRDLPLLASFEDDLEMSRWIHYGARGTRVAKHATAGTWALQVETEAEGYPGTLLRWPASDWSGYRELSLDFFLDESEPLDVVIKIEDDVHEGEYEDRFHRVVHLMPGPHTERISLEEIAAAPKGRRLDLASIRRLQLFLLKPEKPHAFYVDNVRLQ